MFKSYNYNLKNDKVMRLAKTTLAKRNEKFIDFDLTNINVDHILGLNVK